MRQRGRGSRKLAKNWLAGQGLGFQRRGAMGMDFQRIQETAHLGRHELARREQGMHGKRLADMVGQAGA